MASYRSDPREIRLRYPGHCAGCGGTLPAGNHAFFYPIGNHCYGLGGFPCDCGDAARREFESARFDEDVYSQ